LSLRRAGENAFLLGLFTLAILIIWPRGNFPLNDDWDFAIATFNFARTGHFIFTKFTAVSLRAQVIWGALFVKMFGYTFEALRISTLVLSAATILVVRATLERMGVERNMRIFASAALLFHPIFLWSSCTYMTEVPFVFLSAVAMYFFVGQQTAAGCVAALASCFVRQTGVLNFLPPLIIAIHRRRWRDAAIAFVSLAVVGVIAIAQPRWLSGSPAEFAVHYRVWHEESFQLPEILEQGYHWFVFNAQNAGLFFAPLLFVRWTRRQWIAIAAVAIVLLARVQSLIALGHPMPYSSNPWCCDIFGGNILTNFGLGPQSMAGTFPFTMPMGLRLLLTYLSVLLGAFAIVALWKVRNMPALLVLVSTIALNASGLYVDRYALDSAWALVLVVPLLMPRMSKTALIAMAIFSIFATQEYFSWQRARWQAFSDLRARGVAIEQIDGGAEIFDYYELSKGDQRTRRINQFGVQGRPYTISFSAKEHVIARYPWSGWLGLHHSEIRSASPAR
jgi:hypothetical protein